jgi:AcrR family transcriptional regulator
MRVDRPDETVMRPDNVVRYYTGCMTATPQAPRRRDARRNREAILEAARELFAESTDVPMYEVARRAGVGQATLYRNFPDRRDLAAALLAEQVERQELVAGEHAGDPDAFFVLLRSFAENLARFHLLGDLARLEPHRRRVAELMRTPLRDAKAAGALRRDLTIDDVFLLLSMVRGAVERADGPADRAASAGRALALVVDGMAPSSGRA